MKTLHIETLAKVELDVNKLKELVSIIKEKADSGIVITYSIQFLKLAEKVREEMKVSGVNVKKFLQVLGCTKMNFTDLNEKVFVVHIGSGRFHTLNLTQISNNIAIFNGKEIIILDKKELAIYNNRNKGKISKYLMSENVGVVISSKYGQQHLNKALAFIKNNDKVDKKHYMFLCNYVNIGEFENFNNIEFWLNTACPRIDEDNKNVLSIDNLPIY